MTSAQEYVLKTFKSLENETDQEIAAILTIAVILNSIDYNIKKIKEQNER